MPSSVNQPLSEADEAALLDAYLEAMRTGGGQPERARLLADHPELANVLDCLDALAEMAVDPRPVSEVPTILGAPPPGAVNAPERPPQQFGKFDLLRELGKGGMGVVYLARQRDLDRLVALKLIRGQNLATAEQVDRFQGEARTAARLRHPNIVAVYEAGVIDGQHYIAMQYVEGRGLDDLLRTRPLAPDEAAKLLVQVVRAVAYLNGEGLLHRDLKPSNVLVDGHGHPYLTDFGLAKVLTGGGGMTQSGAVLGTPSYMSPEQAAGRKYVGVASDVYALGAVLYELVTGRPPFKAETALDTLVLVLESEPTLPRRLNPRLPRELELICLKCLEKAPEQRYPTATALADDLDRYLCGEAVEARPRGPWQRLLRWARREPALAARLITLTIFLVIIQVYHWVYPNAEELHYAVVGVTVIWAVSSWLGQRLLSRPAWSGVVLYLWAGSEPFLLTALLFLTSTGSGPFLIGFPLLVAGAGLWFRVPLVWVVTVTAEMAYGLLVVLCPELRGAYWLPTVLFPVFLLALGAIVAQQVQRVRVLSRHYEGRTLP